MFLVGALRAVRDARKADHEGPVGREEATSGGRVATTAFVVIFLAEWGDMTQVGDREPDRLIATHRSRLGLAPSVQPGMRENVMCVTPLGDEIVSASYSFSKPSSPSQTQTPRPSRIGDMRVHT